MPDSITGFTLERSPNGTKGDPNGDPYGTLNDPISVWTGPTLGFVVGGTPANVPPGDGSPRSFDDSTPVVTDLYYRLTGHTANGVTIPYNVVKVSNTTPKRLNWVNGFVQSGAQAACFGVAAALDGTYAVVGKFFTNQPTDSINFGGTNNPNPMKSAGGSEPNGFISKYSSAGVCLWTNGVIAPQNTVVNDVVIDSLGNIIASGICSSPAGVPQVKFYSSDGTFVTRTINSTTVPFVVKYSSAGVLIWLKTYTSTFSPPNGVTVALDSLNNILLGITFSASMDCGGGIVITGGGSVWDIGVVKLDGSDGDTIWGHGYGSNGLDYVFAIAATATGDAVITGLLNGAASLGGGTLQSGIILARYSGTDGSHVFSHTYPTPNGTSNGYAVAVDPISGRIYIGGNLVGSADLGSGTISTPYNGGAFIAAYDSSGNGLWAHAYGANNDLTNGITVDPTGNITLTGGCNSLTLFGGASSPYGSAQFIVNYSTTNTGSTYRWSVRSTTAATGQGTSICSDVFGHVISCGWWGGTADFGGQGNSGDTLTGATSGTFNPYVCQYNQ